MTSLPSNHQPGPSLSVTHPVVALDQELVVVASLHALPPISASDLAQALPELGYYQAELRSLREAMEQGSPRTGRPPAGGPAEPVRRVTDR